MPAPDLLTPSVSALLDEGARLLEPVSDSPRLDAEVLLSFVLGRDRAWLRAWPKRQPGREAFGIYQGLIERRRGGEPIAYITGHREFWSLDLVVNRHTLIPRPETETLVEQALACLPVDSPTRVLELGTGCGAIALALAGERPAASITATDVCADALAVARYNARRLARETVTWVESRWYLALGPRRFDLIVSNPPYVADGDPHLDEGDLPFEPDLALKGGRDGLDAIREIVSGAPAHLHAGGWLILEHGPDQADPVGELLDQAGFAGITSIDDLSGAARVSRGRRTG